MTTAETTREREAMEYCQGTDFLDSIRNHFVPIAAKFARIDDQGNETVEYIDKIYSAFVISIAGRWCLVTAGHVIRDIDALEANGEWKLIRFCLADYFGKNAVIKELTPFDYSVHKIHIYRDGIDIALIPLSDFFMKSLAANGVDPIPQARWEGYSPPPCNAFVLLGIPEEETTPIFRMGDRGTREGKSAALNLVWLDAFEQEPSENRQSVVPRFAATLCDGGKLGSPVGMSGGPIIGLRKKASGAWEYACVAVQGSWLESKRRVFGTPIFIVVKQVLTVLLEQALVTEAPTE
jgi:hypothetical protein